MLQINADELPRLIACNGSRLMIGYPEISRETNQQTREEGIAAHWAAHAAYSDGRDISEFADRKAPNGVYITADMIENVDGYLTMLQARGTHANMEFDTSHSGPSWRINGRVDNIQEVGTTLHVDDFKYGWRLVEPEFNWTLISHAIGYITQTQRVLPHICLSIYQPRPFHPDGRIREWKLTYSELLGFADILNKTLSEPSDELITGPHCANCHALASCPAARKASMNSIEASDMAHDEDMPNDELSFELDNLRRASEAIKSRLGAIEGLAKHRLKSGQIIDNYAVEQGFSNKAWIDGITAPVVKAISGIDVSKPGMLTPSQAVKAGMPETLLPALTERKPTAINLVRETAEKRAQRLFGKP